MLRQTKKKLFWPNICGNLKKKYDECNICACAEYRIDKAQAHNKISNGNIFKNFLTGQRLELDYAERENQNYLMIV